MIKMAFDNNSGTADLVFDDGIQTGEELETSILLSMFTWRRAEKDDAVPDSVNRLGFWGDTYPDVPGDKTGSRLWLLSGQAATPDNLELAKNLVLECLQWLLDDGVAESVEPVITESDNNQFRVSTWIKRPTDLAPKFYSVWEGIF
jgi:phage gp46-like protein